MEATILHNHNYITKQRQNTNPHNGINYIKQPELYHKTKTKHKPTQWKQLYYTTITISQNQDKAQNPHNGSNYITQP